MKVLVTGGAGYIGSHTCIELLKSGYEIVVMDNFYNSSPKALDAIKKITGKDFKFYQYDMMNKAQLREIFSENKIDAVIHFAGLKAVGESVKKPLKYYETNIGGTVNLLEAMKESGVSRIVFSSSATVYGPVNPVPYIEGMPLSATNPYGYTKLMIEQIITDLCYAENGFKAMLLRYFNPVGAHESGLIGEDPNDIPNNLMPYIQQVASGKLEKLYVFGNDYPTKDGTGCRDYIHVVDLAVGHLQALEHIEEINGVKAYNLGTGNSTSVLELVAAFEKASGIKIPYEIIGRRDGDLAEYFADASLAAKEIGWNPTRTVDDMCRDSWNFVKTVMVK